MNTLENFHKKAFNIITITGFAAILFFLYLQFNNITSSPINSYSTIASGTVFLISAIICFIYYKRIGEKSAISTAILGTGLSNLLFAAGSFVWGYYNFVGVETPYPSIGDTFFILMPITFAISIGSLLQIYKTSTTKSTVFIASTVFLILASTMFFFYGNPEVSIDLSFAEKFFNIAYTLSDSIYVGAGVALLIIAGGRMYKGIFVWVLAMFIITLGDMVFSYRVTHDIVWSGDIADQLYTLSAIIFTYAAIFLAKTSESKEIQI